VYGSTGFAVRSSQTVKKIAQSNTQKDTPKAAEDSPRTASCEMHDGCKTEEAFSFISSARLSFAAFCYKKNNL
jgi:hypothetical protein